MKNKFILTIALLLTAIMGLAAQYESEPDDNINISVVVPAQIEGLTSGQLSKLQTKMLRMVSNYGISEDGYTNKFILYPKYEIFDHTIVEGMKNVHTIDVELNLIVKEVETGKVYSVFNQEITGDGYSKNQAITQSIAQIKTRGEKIERFLADSKTKILSYYRSNCDRLHGEASTMIKQKRHNEAIALLYPVPYEVGGECYKKIQQKLDQAYQGYLDETCEKNLIRAKVEIANNNKGSALEILGTIEKESNCHTAAQDLKTEIEPQSRDNEPTQKSEGPKVEVAAPKKETKREKMKQIAKAEFQRTRHEGEIDKAIQEG